MRENSTHMIQPLGRTLALLLASASIVCAQIKTFTPIDFPGAAAGLTGGINKHGEVVGVYFFADNVHHGFLWRGGHFTSIDFPGAASTDTFGINDKGDIAGAYVVSGITHGFVLTQGRYIAVDVPGGGGAGVLGGINNSGQIVAAFNLADNNSHTFKISGDTIRNIDYPGAVSTQGNGINTQGDIVGNYTIGGVTHGYLQSNAKFTSFDVQNAAYTGVYGIDAAGNMVGRYRLADGVTHGFVFSGGKSTTVDIAGATYTSLNGINENGDIVGYYIAAGVRHPFVLTSPAVRYQVTDLGVLPGGSFSQASQGATDNGLIAGVADVADGSQHAVLWQYGQTIDLAVPGLGGPNSIAIGLNKWGQVVGQAETSTPDDEDFCAFGTGLQCSPFWWQNGVMTPLATLGGKNGAVSAINRHGEAAGLAESAIQDARCTPPQKFDYKAVVWGPRQGQIRELRPLPGDTVAVALWINDQGQAVGTSGTCDNTVPNGVIVGPHAVLWEKDGTPVDLGNLGGAVNTSLFAVGNRGIYINNLGQVVGGSTLPGNKTAHAFLWTREGGMKDLGALPGDGTSGALGMNERGEVVGVSRDPKGHGRAFLWRDGIMTDLNTLVPAGSPLYLLLANGIDTSGQISGFGLSDKGDLHAFVATPVETVGQNPMPGKQRPAKSERVRQEAQRAWSRFGTQLQPGDVP